MESFSSLGLAESLASALASFGFQGPTPVQAQAVPVILARRDAILESETGTGKTFAYLAPALQLVSVLERRQSGEPGVIVAAPTQELAVQIGREAEKLAKAAGLSARVAVLLGGTPLEKQAAKLKERPDIVVGTPGRLADLVALRKLRTSSLKLLVLDEADRLFAPENEELARALLKSAPSSCARVLASATIPDRVRREARPYLRDAVDISPGGEGVLSGSIEHWCFYCDSRKRLDFARRFEAAVKPERCLVFLSAAARIEKAALALEKLGLPIEAIHGSMDKEARRVSLERFAAGKIRYLLTSDLGARGLDIPNVSHVLSLDLPEEPTIYTHRAGRTGRAGAKGVSIALADGVELARASRIAVRGGFVFRCKDLERGEVVEPTSAEFFEHANSKEDDRRARRAARVADGERRASRSFAGRPSRSTSEGRATHTASEGRATHTASEGRAARPTFEGRVARTAPEGRAPRPTSESRVARTAPESRAPQPTSESRVARTAPRGAAAPGSRAATERLAGDSSDKRRSPGGRAAEVGKRPDAVRRERPDAARRGPDAVRRSPDAARHSPDAVRRGPDAARRSPDAARRGPTGGKAAAKGGRQGRSASPGPRRSDEPGGRAR